MATTEEVGRILADKQGDAGGMACSGPQLEAKREITSMPVGGVTEMLSSDQSTNKDIPRWSKKTRHEYLGTIEQPSYWRIFDKREK